MLPYTQLMMHTGGDRPMPHMLSGGVIKAPFEESIQPRGYKHPTGAYVLHETVNDVLQQQMIQQQMHAVPKGN